MSNSVDSRDMLISPMHNSQSDTRIRVIKRCIKNSTSSIAFYCGLAQHVFLTLTRFTAVTERSKSPSPRNRSALQNALLYGSRRCGLVHGKLEFACRERTCAVGSNIVDREFQSIRHSRFHENKICSFHVREHTCLLLRS